MNVYYDYKLPRINRRDYRKKRIIGKGDGREPIEFAREKLPPRGSRGAPKITSVMKGNKLRKTHKGTHMHYMCDCSRRVQITIL